MRLTSRLFAFACFAFVAFFAQAAPCNNQIDKKKIIFFVDAIGDLPALDAAESGGCERGEFVISVPPREVIEFTYKNLKAPQDVLLKALDTAAEEIKKAQAEFDICDPAICSKERRKDLQTVVKEAKLKYKKLRVDYADVEPKFLKEYKEKFLVEAVDPRVKILFELGEMKKKGQTLTSVVLSGYGGGDELHGVLTSKLFYKAPIHRSEFREAFKMYPTVAYDTSLLVLSKDEPLTEFEVAEWRRVLPKLKAWFLLDDNPVSVKDTLAKPMFIDAFGIAKKPLTVESELQVCDKFLEQMVHGIEMNYFNFFYGKHLGPKDSPHTVLRNHYSFFKDYKNCLAVHYPQIAIEQSAFLIYFENVKKNFSHVFQKEIAEGERAIAHLSEDVWGVRLSSEVKALKEGYTSLKPEKIASATRAQIIHNIALMSLAQSPEIVRLKKLIQKYLFELSPKCMKIDEWYDFNPKKKPEAGCKP